MKDYAIEIIEYFEAMREAWRKMPSWRRQEFQEWRGRSGSICDHDWPGWETLIGRYPTRRLKVVPRGRVPA